ncbi:uncharacterized protein L969DRAFT_18175 [Mixia osmundae IAM 14324]|uniref:DASH complex subunit DAM1 n=1 Tax=Mixia osmundae (strain CBS 9802 / IAM 14324 / JCM 22182 / KY 12970) TaxID=764103 RepID=G7E6Q5_MIXOS|nr:uncharacterized protein L969DRAFT_18175 [Mixia osmundae IAM 14324]KEI39103.1 hypothetical protein L969DRAFT_18175 [Mixia osmundae IAM 14324]GAA98515.1 hypothetical protein E5Q_05201 [Mixia osmundae IAM 14324]
MTSQEAHVRPTTPIRRISRGSLSALSASRSGANGAPLAHLESVFGELRDAMEDYSSHMASLCEINNGLDRFNQAFAGYLYGLKMNAYTTEYSEAPAKISYELAAQRHASQQQAQQQPTAAQQPPPKEEPPSTTVTATTSAPAQRGRVTSGTRGRGGAPSSGRNAAAAEKKALAAFAGTILDTLPIKYREQEPHRSEMQSVIILLKRKPEGMSVAEITASDPKIASHRANQCLLALVAAKHATKSTNGGLTYRLNAA